MASSTLWSASQIRHTYSEYLLTPGAQEPPYVTDGTAAAHPDLVRHAEESMHKEGILRPRFGLVDRANAQFTVGGRKVADRWRAANLGEPATMPVGQVASRRDLAKAVGRKAAELPKKRKGSE